MDWIVMKERVEQVTGNGEIYDGFEIIVVNANKIHDISFDENDDDMYHVRAERDYHSGEIIFKCKRFSEALNVAKKAREEINNNV